MRRAVPPFRPAALLLVVAAAIAAACTHGDSITDPNAPKALALKLTPGNDTIYVADTLTDADELQVQLSATSLGQPVTTPTGVEWSTSDPNVAIVTDGSGVVRATGPGTAQITARVNDERAKTVVVVARRATHVDVSPSVLIGLAGDTVDITGRALDEADKLVPRTAYGFGVSDPAVASIQRIGNQTARVIFLKPGPVQVNVSAAGKVTTVTGTTQVREFIAGAQGATLSAGLNTTCGLLPLDRGYCFGSAPTIGVARDTSCFDDRDETDTLKHPVRLPCTLIPLRIAGDLALKQVSVGDSVACGVTSGNRAYCWGSDLYGQLGNGSSALGTSLVPTLVIGAVTRNAVSLTQVSAGGVHACGLTPVGKADCWGEDSTLQLGDDRPVNSTTPIPVNDAFTFTSISAGRNHTCALQADGVAYCWGSNLYGQLGRGTTGNTLPLFAATDAVAGGSIRFTAISAGARHTCGLAVGGTVYCWGHNAAGELGRGAVGADDGSPVAVTGGVTYAAVDAGRDFTCAITTTGAAFCWGLNAYGQIGNGVGGGQGGGPPVPSPTAVVGGHTFSVITAGDRHVCGIATDASVPGAYCWGSNVLGSLGNELQAAVRSSPQKVATPH
jgi:alpha-tubulin suppressor-like RCC1 family protein